MNKLFKNNSEVISLNDPLSWISVLKKNRITHLVMAGKINRISNEELHDNELSHDLIKKTFSLGDNSALNLIEDFFNENGFEIIPVTSILKDCFFPKGFYNEEFFSNADFIIHGHTHRYRLEKVNNCIIFNPGECAGFMKGKNKIGVVDLKTKEAKTISF